MRLVHDTAVRIAWEELPPPVRRAVEDLVGAEIVTAANQRGGYSPSMAAACKLATGGMIFVKAVSPDQNLEATEILRREALVTAALPDTVPAPRLLHLLDDGHWVVAVYEHVEGRLPHMPWSARQLGLVLGATWMLARIEPPPWLPTIEERYGPMLDGWRNLAAGGALDGVLDDWSARHVDRLASIEPQWVEATIGRELVHGDVRSDNVLIDGDRVTFVDWPAACVGQVFFDVVSMLPSVSLEGGGDPDEVLAAHGGETLDPEAVTALVVADAGYFLDRARRPDPPGLPTVRRFQRAQGEVCVRWLKTRLGWR